MENIRIKSLAPRISPFIVFSSLEGFVLVYPVYMIMLSSWGLDYVELSLTLSIWAAPVVILEIPSSIVADRWSKRHIVAIGMAMKALGYAIWLAWPGFAGACAGFVLWGCQEALCSGARQALLYERLSAIGMESRYEEAAGLCGAAGSIAVACALVAGGLLYGLGPAYVIAPSIASSAAGALIALRFEDARTGARGSGRSKSATGLVTTLKGSLSAPGIPALLAFACVTAAVCGTVEEYDGLWYQQRFGLPLSLVGLWSSLRFGAEALGGIVSGLARRALDRVGRPGMSACIAAAGLAFAASAILPGLAGAPPYLLYFIAMAALAIVTEGRLQACATDEIRATLISISNMLMTLAAIAISPVLGLMAEHGGLAAAFVAAGLITAAAAPIAMLGRRPTSDG